MTNWEIVRHAIFITEFQVKTDAIPQFTIKNYLLRQIATVKCITANRNLQISITTSSSPYLI